MKPQRLGSRAGVKVTRKVRVFAHRGFTLPELLVVLAVMAVLVGLIFPMLSKSTAKNHRIHCVGKLKNIGLSTRIFATDNNELFPWQTNFAKLQDLPPGDQVVRI